MKRKNRFWAIITMMILFASTGYVGCKITSGPLMLASLVFGLLIFYFTMEEYV